MARKILLNHTGQSTVEYIMLIAVITSLSLIVFKSGPFKQFFGNNSVVFDMVAKRTEWNYRFSGMDEKPTPDYVNGFNENYQDSPHPSYYWNTGQGTNTRFFVPIEAYPGP